MAVSGLNCKRVVRGDTPGLSILRQEVAHLAHRDMSAVRREALAAGASIFAMRSAAVICAAALLGLVLAADVGTFPLASTSPKILAVHVALVTATAIVTLPLLKGPT